jgi:anti-anti-sigma factor
MNRNEVLPEQLWLAQEVEDAVVRLRLFGELDLATVPLLESELAKATREAIVLDLGELTFIDVAGLRAVLQDLSLVDGSRPVRRLFELTGHEHLLDAGADPSGDHG